MPAVELGWVKEIRTRPGFCAEGETNGSTFERFAHPETNMLNAQPTMQSSKILLQESIAEKK